MRGIVNTVSKAQRRWKGSKDGRYRKTHLNAGGMGREHPNKKSASLV